MFSGFNDRECRMNVGKTLFAQVMEFVPWKTFGRIIERHKGDAGVRTLGCADMFRVTAFSQLTWRESLRDIEVCLEANHAKLFHMGTFRHTYRSWLDETGAPMKVQQELMRHASIQTTMNVYGQAMSNSKREANSKIVEMVLRPARMSA